MKFIQAKTEQLRDQVKQEIANVEVQLWNRQRDLACWREVQAHPLTEAIAADSRVANNRDEEAKQNIAGALYDIAKLETRLRFSAEALVQLEAPAPKA